MADQPQQIAPSPTAAAVNNVRLPKPSYPLATPDGKCPYSSICVWKQITETAVAPAVEPVEVVPAAPAPMREDERGDWTRRLRQAEQRSETAEATIRQLRAEIAASKPRRTA